MNTGIHVMLFILLIFLVCAAPLFIMADAQTTAMRICQIEHSHDVCFEALNR